MLVRRLLIVDEQPLYRLGIRDALQHAGQLRLGGEAGSVHQALRAAQQFRPHIVVISASLPGISGLTLVETLMERSRDCRCVLVFEELSADHLATAQRAGAVAALQRSIGATEIVRAITRIAVLPPAGAGQERGARAADQQVVERKQPLRLLSTKEMEILDCVAHGFSNKEIASELFVTEQTVKNHMTSVFRKLEVEDRVQALLFAVRQGWVTFGQQPRRDNRQRSSA